MRTRLPMIFLAACSAGPGNQPPPPMLTPRDPVPAQQAFTPPQTMAAARVDGLQPRTTTIASYSIYTGRTVCHAEDGRLTPFIDCLNGQPPMVGVPWEVIAWTRAQPAPDTEMAWLMVGWRPLAAPVDYSNQGMPGCMLLMYPEAWVQIPVGYNDGMISRLTGTPGRIALKWTPTADAMGKTIWLQLIVADPTANRVGLLTGAAMRATIGSP